MATINKLDKFANKMMKIIKSTEGHPRVSIGFLAGATYPDGTSVATIAAIQEFGSPSDNIPPRPFFRFMVAEKSRDWPDAVRQNLKDTDYNVHTTLDRMGQGIKGQLQDSIKSLMDPPNAPATIRKKGFDNPLIDTGHMLNSVDYRVED